MKRRTRSRAPSKAAVAAWLSACTPRCTLACEWRLVVLDGADHLRAGAARRPRCPGTPADGRARGVARIGKVAPHALDVVRGHGGSGGGVRGHHVAPSRVASCSAPARLVSIWRRSCRHLDRRDRVLEEGPLEQALRRVAARARATAGRTACGRRACRRWRRGCSAHRRCRSPAAGARRSPPRARRAGRAVTAWNRCRWRPRRRRSCR